MEIREGKIIDYSQEPTFWQKIIATPKTIYEHLGKLAAENYYNQVKKQEDIEFKKQMALLEFNSEITKAKIIYQIMYEKRKFDLGKSLNELGKQAYSEVQKMVGIGMDIKRAESNVEKIMKEFR